MAGRRHPDVGEPRWPVSFRPPRLSTEPTPHHDSHDHRGQRHRSCRLIQALSIGQGPLFAWQSRTTEATSAGRARPAGQFEDPNLNPGILGFNQRNGRRRQFSDREIISPLPRPRPDRFPDTRDERAASRRSIRHPGTADGLEGHHHADSNSKSGWPKGSSDIRHRRLRRQTRAPPDRRTRGSA